VKSKWVAKASVVLEIKKLQKYKNMLAVKIAEARKYNHQF